MPTNGIYPGENQAGLQTELDRRGWRLEELPNPFSKQISTFKWSFKVPQRTRNKVCFSLNYFEFIHLDTLLTCRSGRQVWATDMGLHRPWVWWGWKLHVAHVSICCRRTRIKVCQKRRSQSKRLNSSGWSYQPKEAKANIIKLRNKSYTNHH